jgi:hypothetical protein
VNGLRKRLAAVILVALGAGVACYDFNADYDTYCLSGRCADAGSPAGDTGFVDAGGPGPDSGPPPDAGPADSGLPGDAGPRPCRAWGMACTSTAQCCNPPGADGGVDSGVGLGCSQLDVCEFRPAGCLPDGYHCGSSSDCCNGQCNAGFCYHCGTPSSGIPCQRATDCCVDDGAYCSSSNICSPLGTTEVNAHCLSADFCGTGECAFDAGADAGNDAGADGGPLDGRCASTVGQCTGLGQQPGSGGLPCCPGTSFSCLPAGSYCASGNDALLCCSGACSNNNTCAPSGPGDGGVCCMPTGTPCLNHASCYSNICLEGLCADVAVPYPQGHPCVAGADCANGLFCDRITLTCQKQFCIPQQPAPGWGGCGLLSGSTLSLLDGGSCSMGGFIGCTKGSDCCSGTCLNFGMISFCIGPAFVQ